MRRETDLLQHMSAHICPLQPELSGLTDMKRISAGLHTGDSNMRFGQNCMLEEKVYTRKINVIF
jgi:hypothetical protein